MSEAGIMAAFKTLGFLPAVIVAASTRSRFCNDFHQMTTKASPLLQEGRG